jgi:hypothetical protein
LTIQYGNLPFDEAIKFFREKVPIPTERWNDLWKDMHARGFMVAGAMQSDLLTGLFNAVDKAISKGVTIDEFRRDFDEIVKKTGWTYNGSRGWRTRLIYETNIKTAHAAGRWAQMTDPDVVKLRPYLMYRHGGSMEPRPEHLSWNGMVLPADDPWWQTHYPPNGWGCSCFVQTVSERELAAMGKDGPDRAPKTEHYQWTDKKTGETHQVPKGIDPGWDYNVGEAAWGKNEALRMMDDSGPWVDINPYGPEHYNRPEKIEPDMPQAEIGQRVKKGDVAGLREALTRAIGDDEVLFTDPIGGKVLVTQAIVDHILEDPDDRWNGREAYFTLIPELIEQPYEIWVSFAKSEISGRVGIRRKYVKAIQTKDKKVLGLFAEFMNGHWVGGSLFHGKLTGAGNLRKGRMIYGK